MEEDLKVKATEFEDIEEVWLLHDVTMLAAAARILLFMIR